MGKLSEALKKSLHDRQEQKQLREQQRQLKEKELRASLPRVVEQQKSEVPASPPVPPSDETKKTGVAAITEAHAKRLGSLFLSWKDKLTEYAKSAVYVVKAKDDSGIDPRVITYYDYQTPIADQYRIIRTNLKSHFKKTSSFSNTMSSPQAMKTIAVSSALHGEGKSITAANLAIVLAHDLESKVLLFDCDLRKGAISKLFNLKADCGLSDILTDSIDYNHAIYPTHVDNLFIMPAGTTPTKPLELLSSKRMKLLFEQLKADSFTTIVVDTPPLSLFSDAGVVAAETDGLVFVVQAYKTPLQIVKRAKELAEHAHVKIIGFVLTHTDYHIPHIYGYHQYHKYYSRSEN